MINVLLIILLIIVAILIIINLCLNGNTIHAKNKTAINKKGGMVISSYGNNGSISAAEYLADLNNFNPITGVLTIQPEITQISNDTFKFRSYIKSINIIDRPDLLSIGGQAFALCNIIGKLIIPPCVLRIGNSAFSNNTNLTSINIIDRSNPLIIDNNAFYECNITGELIIPPCISRIGNATFYKNINLTSINIIDRSNPLIISNNAFFNCSQLGGNLNLAYVSEIGNSAFIHTGPFEYVILSPDMYPNRATELQRIGISVIDNDDQRIIEYNPDNWERQKAALQLTTAVNQGYITKNLPNPIPLSEIKATASIGSPKYNTISVLGNPKYYKNIINKLG